MVLQGIMSLSGLPDLEDFDLPIAPVRSTSSVSAPAAPVKTNAPSSQTIITNTDEVSLRDLMMESAMATNPKKRTDVIPASTITKPVASDTNKKSSSGLKKGFLLSSGSSSSTKSSSAAASVPMIAPQSKASSPLVFSEVQEAMQDSMPPMQRLAADTQSASFNNVVFESSIIHPILSIVSQSGSPLI